MTTTTQTDLWQQYSDGSYYILLADGFVGLTVEQYRDKWEWKVNGRWHHIDYADTLEEAKAAGLQKLRELVSAVVQELGEP